MLNLKLQAQTRLIQQHQTALKKLDEAQPGIERFEALCETLKEQGLNFTADISVLNHCPVEYTLTCSSLNAGEIMIALANLGCDQRGKWHGGSKKFATICSDRTQDFCLAVEPATTQTEQAAA